MTKEDRRAYDKELYEWYKEHKFCVRCRREKAASGRVLCLNCLDEQRIRDEIRREEKKAYREKNKEKNRTKCKSRYYTLKAQGLCTDCGAKPATQGVFCLCCWVKRKRRDQNRRDVQGNTTLLRYENGLCMECGQPLDTDKKWCKACCDRVRSFKTTWWQRLRDNDPERYKALVRSMRPVSGMSLYGKYAREGVTT